MAKQYHDVFDLKFFRLGSNERFAGSRAVFSSEPVVLLPLRERSAGLLSMAIRPSVVIKLAATASQLTSPMRGSPRQLNSPHCTVVIVGLAVVEDEA